MGKKNKAQFRVTVADARRSPTGKFIEILGHYNPHTKEKVFKQERVEYWISKGAQPSATVHNFLIDAGILKGDKVIAWKPKKKKGEEKEENAKKQEKVDKPSEEKAEPELKKTETPKTEIKLEEAKPEGVKKEEQKIDTEPAK